MHSWLKEFDVMFTPKIQMQIDLMCKAGSSDNATALNALHELDSRGWLKGDQGLLRGTPLYQANFQGADLRGANLERAMLMYANLAGANLEGARLKGADLTDAQFDTKTVLPDAIWDEETSQYTPGSYYQPGVTDMEMYIHPEHPDFWQPE